MDFNAGSIMINEPFQNYIERDEFDNKFTKRKSYIYVISKVFDGTRYYKVGMSTKSDIDRMRDANTYLIPGKENKAYQVHYLFFYDESPYKNSFAHYIEKEIHAVLRHEFDSYNIRFLTNNPSEWYLPQKTNSSNNRRRTRRSQSSSMLTNDAAQPVRDPQPESSIDAALGDAFTSQGRSNGTLASGPEGGSQGGTPSSPRVNPL